jgi:hypothetical protein
MAQYHDAEAAYRQAQCHVLDRAPQPVGGVSQYVVRYLRVGVVEDVFHSQRCHGVFVFVFVFVFVCVCVCLRVRVFGRYF